MTSKVNELESKPSIYNPREGRRNKGGEEKCEEREGGAGSPPSFVSRFLRISRLPYPLTGAPNDGFLPNALKRCFRLSRVLLKLCRLILGCAINVLSVRSF